MEDDIQHIQELLAAKKAHLQAAEVQSARYGESAIPSYLALDIAKDKKDIELLETRLRSVGSSDVIQAVGQDGLFLSIDYRLRLLLQQNEAQRKSEAEYRTNDGEEREKAQAILRLCLIGLFIMAFIIVVLVVGVLIVVIYFQYHFVITPR